MVSPNPLLLSTGVGFRTGRVFEKFMQVLGEIVGDRDLGLIMEVKMKMIPNC